MFGSRPFKTYNGGNFAREQQAKQPADIATFEVLLPRTSFSASAHPSARSHPCSRNAAFDRPLILSRTEREQGSLAERETTPAAKQ
jgi:hypothetical protein